MLEPTSEEERAVINFANIILDVAKEKCRRENKLKNFPNGFHLDRSGYCCRICGNIAAEENSWYDKCGLKCMTCQKAINAKVIPGSVAVDSESWYSKEQMNSYFNINSADLKKYIKQLILKDRIIQGDGKNVHLQLFLIKDNKTVLPPKKLLNSRTVKTTWKGEEYYTSENWYQFIDAESYKRLSKYKIVDCLRETLARPIKAGRFLYKGLNPMFTHLY